MKNIISKSHGEKLVNSGKAVKITTVIDHDGQRYQCIARYDTHTTVHYKLPTVK